MYPKKKSSGIHWESRFEGTKITIQTALNGNHWEFLVIRKKKKRSYGATRVGIPNGIPTSVCKKARVFPFKRGHRAISLQKIKIEAISLSKREMGAMSLFKLEIGDVPFL